MNLNHFRSSSLLLLQCIICRPILKTWTLDPCYPHRKKDTSRHADILGVEENTNLFLLE